MCGNETSGEIRTDCVGCPRRAKHLTVSLSGTARQEEYSGEEDQLLKDLRS